MVFSRIQPNIRKCFPKIFLKCNQTHENIFFSGKYLFSGNTFTRTKRSLSAMFSVGLMSAKLYFVWCDYNLYLIVTITTIISFKLWIFNYYFGGYGHNSRTSKFWCSQSRSLWGHKLLNKCLVVLMVTIRQGSHGFHHSFFFL